MTIETPSSMLPVATGRPCPVCRGPLDGTPVVTCATCETPVHEECQREAGGCVRFACPQAATPRTRLVKALVATSRASATGNLALTVLASFITFCLYKIGPSSLLWLMVEGGLTVAPLLRALAWGGMLVVLWSSVRAVAALREMYALRSGQVSAAQLARLFDAASDRVPRRLAALLERTRRESADQSRLANLDDSRLAQHAARQGIRKATSALFACVPMVLLAAWYPAPILLVMALAGALTGFWSMIRARAIAAEVDAAWMLGAWGHELRELLDTAPALPLAEIGTSPVKKATALSAAPCAGGGRQGETPPGPWR